MSEPLEQSYRYCVHIARTQARNFYYSFLCLPRAKREAMCAIYAFMRFSDDISDGDPRGGAVPDSADRAGRMIAWRGAMDAALAGEDGESPIWPAFRDTVNRYGIPVTYLHSLIDGTEMDLQPRRFETFADTYDYCYHVASVVGLVCIHVFGFRDPRAIELAEWNGVAFQLTNILRDLREDGRLGRVYLPQEDLRRFGYSEEMLAQGRDSEAFRSLMRFEVARARDYYDRAAPLVDLIEPDSRPCLRAMREIYGGILQCIVSRDYDVFTRRARVPTWRKLMVASRAICEARLGRRPGLSSAS